MNRGEVRWFTFRPPDKRRPVVILTRASALQFLDRVTIAPVTRNIRHIGSEVVVGRSDGFAADSAINLDNVTTVPLALLGPVISVLSDALMEEIGRALLYALGFERLQGSGL